MAGELMQLEAVEGQDVVVAMQSRAKTLAANAARIVVKDAESDQRAASFVIELAAAQKEAEKVRKSFTIPLSTAKKNIDAFFKQITAPFAEAREVVDEKRKAYFREQEQRRREEEERIRKENERREAERARLEAEQARLEAEAAKKNEPPPEPLPPPPPELEPIVAAPPIPAKTVRGIKGGSSTMKSHWTFEIVDPSKVPAKYWCINEKLIGEVVRGGVITEIPGVRIYEEIITSTRTA